jgi:hypothetical protein
LHWYVDIAKKIIEALEASHDYKVGTAKRAAPSNSLQERLALFLLQARPLQTAIDIQYFY